MTPSPPEPNVSNHCSAKGCRADAEYALMWNNPKLHTPDRLKTWLACEEHRVSLSYFLSVRGFLKDTLAVSALGDPQGADELG